MRREGGFTLFEIILAVFIAVLLILLAIPSIEGVFAEGRMKRSFEAFDELVRTAQSRSLAEQRAYVLAWEKGRIALRPDELRPEDDASGVAQLDVANDESYELELPAALLPHPPTVWVFWPSGTC